MGKTMQNGRFYVLIAAAVLLFAGLDSYSQGTETFSDPNVEYSFEIPDAKWKMTAKPSVTNPNVEFVYVDRLDGHLEVRKVSSPRTSPISDVIKDEEQKVQFLPGYVAGREENFGGKLNGAVFNFEFVRAGRPMSGRFYFLRSGESVYILRFTGMREKLRSIKHHTDMIARTFGTRS